VMHRHLDKDEIKKSLRDLIENAPPPNWLVEMIEHYQRTGAFRPEDLRRLLGDPSKGVIVSAETTIDDILNQS
jgi:hypothetical protein